MHSFSFHTLILNPYTRSHSIHPFLIHTLVLIPYTHSYSIHSFSFFTFFVPFLSKSPLPSPFFLFFSSLLSCPPPPCLSFPSSYFFSPLYHLCPWLLFAHFLTLPLSLLSSSCSQQYPSVVVSCCLKAMRHGSRAATQQFPRLLQLLELHPDTLYHFKKKVFYYSLHCVCVAQAMAMHILYSPLGTTRPFVTAPPSFNHVSPSQF